MPLITESNPLQKDGTWTDIPRCIEHEPGIEEQERRLFTPLLFARESEQSNRSRSLQVPGICPGIPGYCSLEYAGGLCEFDCLIGPDIRSTCTKDGTWEPYPTCDGDIRLG